MVSNKVTSTAHQDKWFVLDPASRDGISKIMPNLGCSAWLDSLMQAMGYASSRFWTTVLVPLFPTQKNAGGTGQQQ